MMGEEKGGDGDRAPGAAFPPADAGKSQDADDGKQGRNPATDLDDALRIAACAAEGAGEFDAFEQEKRVMKIPLALDELFYFYRFVGMIVVREIVVPGVEPKAAEKDDKG